MQQGFQLLCYLVTVLFRAGEKKRVPEAGSKKNIRSNRENRIEKENSRKDEAIMEEVEISAKGDSRWRHGGTKRKIEEEKRKIQGGN